MGLARSVLAAPVPCALCTVSGALRICPTSLGVTLITVPRGLPVPCPARPSCLQAPYAPSTSHRSKHSRVLRNVLGA